MTHDATHARRPRAAHAFTLVEVLVALGIVALLVGILVPVLGGVRAEARRAQCLANLRSQGLALEAYRKDYRFWPDSPPYPDFASGQISLARALTETGALDAPMPVAGQSVGDPWRCRADDGMGVRVGSSYLYRPGMLAFALRLEHGSNPEWRFERVWRQVGFIFENDTGMAMMSDALPPKVVQETGRDVSKRPWHGFGPSREYLQGVFLDGSARWVAPPKSPS